MKIIEFISLGILIILLGMQIIKRPLLVKRSKQFFYLSLAIVGVLLFYQTRAQFLAWSLASPPAKFLVPPYQGIGYLLFYAISRFWAKYLISLGLAFIALLTATYFNKKHGGKFFYSEEPYLIATSIFLVGNPLWLIYLILVITLYLLYSLILLKRKRVSFYYFWLPAAILIIGLTPYLKSLSLFTALKL